VIRSRHRSDHVLEVRRDPRTAGAPRLPPPKQAESLPVPPHERIGPHDDEELSPVDRVREHDERDSGRIVQAPRPNVPFDVESQLFAEEEVFGCETGAG